MDVWGKIKDVFQTRCLLPVSLGAVLAAVGVRMIQFHVAIDLSTGFFSRKSLVVPLLTVLIVLYGIYVLLWVNFKQPKLEQPYQNRQLKPAGIISLISGGVIIISGLSGVLTAAGAAANLKTLDLLSLLLGIASSGVLLYQGVLLLHRNIERLQNHMLMVIVAVWMLFHLMNTFVQHMTIASISEQLFEVLFNAAAVLFLFYFSRFTAGLLRPRQVRLFMITGALSVILGAVSTLPSLLCKLLEYKGIGRYLSFPDFSMLFLTVFIGCMLTLFVKSIKDGRSLEKTDDMESITCDYLYEAVHPNGLFQ